MFNPYLILGAVIFLAVACAGSYLKGYKNAENAAAVKQADALSDAIANARKSAEIDVRLAVAAAEKRQKVRTEFKEKIVTVEREIHANPSPRECRLTDNTVELLNSAVRDANNTQKPPKPVPMPKPAPAPERPTGHISAGLSTDY